MRSCSVLRGLEIVRGGGDDYRRLSHFHYRGSRLGPYSAIFALRAKGRLARRLGKRAVGVIVYTMPLGQLELRNAALGGIFSGLDRRTYLWLVNRNIRSISRVIIEPRFRGLGLASRLVRETMPKMDVPFVEGLAVMGRVNPFFEKAGMLAYKAQRSRRCAELIEAFSFVGIEEREFIDPKGVQKKLKRLGGKEAKFIEFQTRRFLEGYGSRGRMGSGFERTAYVLSKLGERPVYYIWFNPVLKLRTS
ncbi:MAG: hypothetical protein ACYS18_01935 [Planctomycetota bacterium]